MRAHLIACAVALALVGCGGGGGSAPAADQPPAAAKIADSGNAWTAADLTPASIAVPAAAQAVFLAESPYSVGDYVVNCYDGSHDTVAALSYPDDNTAQLSGGHWVRTADLIPDGPPYACEVSP